MQVADLGHGSFIGITGRTADNSTLRELKRCTKCRLTKSSQAFSSNRRKLDGLDVHCRECIRERIRNKKALHIAKGLCPDCGRRRDSSSLRYCGVAGIQLAFKSCVSTAIWHEEAMVPVLTWANSIGAPSWRPESTTRARASARAASGAWPNLSSTRTRSDRVDCSHAAAPARVRRR